MKVKESVCVSGINRPPAGGGRPGLSPPPRESACVLVYLFFCLALLAGLPTGAVAQDPPTVTLSVSSSTVDEGGTVTLTATLSEADIFSNDILLARDSSSTVESDDYCAIPQINIPSGMTTGTAQFQTRADMDSEEEMIILRIRGNALPVGYVLGDPDRVTITIRDTGTDLPTNPAATFALPSESAGEDAGTHGVSVNLSPPPTSDFTLSYSVSGTATQDTDYSITGSGSVPVSLGACSASIPVEITDDSDDEGDETVILTLTDGTDYTVGTQNVYTLTITDNDGAPSPSNDPPTVNFSPLSVTVEEGEKATITAKLSHPLFTAITILLSVTDNGNAEIGDYGAVGSIHIPAGETTGSVEIQTNPDSGNNHETLVVVLRPDSSYVLGDDSSVQINIHDTTLPEVSFKTSSSIWEEGSSGTRDVEISLSPPTAQRLTINYSDDGTGTAISGTDYTAITSPSTISVDSEKAEDKFSVDILVADNSEDEGPKTVVLALAEGNGYVLGSVNKHTLIITDNDPPQNNTTPEVSISGGTSVITEGEAVTFTLTASPPPQNNTSVNVEVIGSSFAASGERTVTVGTDGGGTFEVMTRDDDEDESDDKVTAFVVTGSSYSPADGTGSVASVSVRDNDEPRPVTTQPVTPPPPPTVTPRPAPPRPAPPPPAAPTNPDRAALLEIYKATGGESWENRDGWSSESEQIGNWHGVAVDGEDRVTGLYLQDNGLSGDFPVSELAAMMELRELALWGNEDLAGAPDDERVDRAVLWVFYEDNGDSAINGWFPEGETDYFSYSGWEEVTADDSGRITGLDFSDNSGLTGDLPLGIMSLSALTSLDISGTMLCVPENEEFVAWVKREGFVFTENGACEEYEEGTGEEVQGGGEGGCAVASDAERGVFQLVLAVFVLLAAGGGRIGRR